jgi:anaerobic selenocysteine-containing dehydrogenase
MVGGQFLTRALGTRSRYSATSADQLPHMLAALEMFGHQLLLPVPDLDRTDFLLVLGANPLASNGSLMTAPDVGKRLAAIRARGGKVVVVDPRRTETAEIADQHVFIRPGGDAALLLAMVHVIFAEKLDRPARLAGFVDGFDELRAAVLPFTPERVAGPTGIDAVTIRELARAFAKSDRAACYGRVGVCTQEFGGVAAWLCYALDIVTGNLDREGGAMFTTPAVDIVSALAKVGMRGHFAKGRTRVRGLPEFGGEYPVSALAEELDTPGKGQLRALVTSCGNPVLSTPNGARLDRGLASIDFMLSVDLYRNETTRHAHLILPPTWALEHDHYDLAFHALAIRNTARYNEPLFAPEKGARHDWQIFLDLATRIERRKGVRAAVEAQATRAVVSRLGPSALIDAGLRAGPYGTGIRPGGLTLAKVRAAPHGLDLGPLKPCLPGRLYTKSHRVALAPSLFLSDLPRVEAWLGVAQSGLSLIGRRDLRSNNSWMHNSRRLVKGPERCTLLMHPDDASRRSLADGQMVRVSSRVGAVTARLEVSADVMPGVVSLPHGWGHDRKGASLSVAAERPGVSANDLTDEAQLDPLSGNARLNGVPVDVAAATLRSARL